MPRIQVTFRDPPDFQRKMGVNWKRIVPEIIIPGIIIIISCGIASKVAKILQRKPDTKE